jgi:hypothetical protein
MLELTAEYALRAAADLAAAASYRRTTGEIAAALRLSAPGRLDETFQVTVERGVADAFRVAVEDRRMWDPIQVRPGEATNQSQPMAVACHSHAIARLASAASFLASSYWALARMTVTVTARMGAPACRARGPRACFSGAKPPRTWLRPTPLPSDQRTRWPGAPHRG